MCLGTLKSAQFFHGEMLTRILHAPMSFFDTTPVGRIVNRFSKDLDVADNTLPLNIRLWLNSFFQVVSTIVVISYSTPIFVAVIVPVGILYYFVQVTVYSLVLFAPLIPHENQELVAHAIIYFYRKFTCHRLDS